MPITLENTSFLYADWQYNVNNTHQKWGRSEKRANKIVDDNSRWSIYRIGCRMFVSDNISTGFDPNLENMIQVHIDVNFVILN